jgi:Mg-chelatase subunit ChlD
VRIGFLSPLFLIGLTAVTVPVFLHLLRRHADPVVLFSAVRFLRRAPVEQARRKRLRELLLLALRVAALALLAGSFARPYLAPTAAAEPAAVTIVAMDTSYSMSSPAQVQRSRTLAERAVTDAPSGHLVALIGFDENASVIVPATADRGAVRAAIANVSPGPRGTRYASALAAAADVAATRAGTVVIVTDLQQTGWRDAAGSLPSGLTLAVRDAGPPDGNIAVTGIQRSGNGLTATLASSWRASQT